MRRIIETLLEEGIDEQMVHRVLDLIEEEYEVIESLTYYPGMYNDEADSSVHKSAERHYKKQQKNITREIKKAEKDLADKIDNEFKAAKNKGQTESVYKHIRKEDPVFPSDGSTLGDAVANKQIEASKAHSDKEKSENKLKDLSDKRAHNQTKQAEAHIAKNKALYKEGK